MAKKTPTMIQRLKKWKKYKGISKEDIQKYGTPEEIKLFEGFEDEHGIGDEGNGDDDDFFELSGGDEEESPLDEELPLEAEQEAGTDNDIVSVPLNLLEDILDFIMGTDRFIRISGQREKIVAQISKLLGVEANAEEGSEIPWEKSKK